MTEPVTLATSPPRVERQPYNAKTGERLIITTTEITVLRDMTEEEQQAIRDALTHE